MDRDFRQEWEAEVDNKGNPIIFAPSEHQCVVDMEWIEDLLNEIDRLRGEEDNGSD